MKNSIKLFIEKYSFILGLFLTLSACTQTNGALEKLPTSPTDNRSGEPLTAEELAIQTTGTQIENAGGREISGSSFIRIRTTDSDSFASLAEKYLGNTSKGWMIREFNQLNKIVSGQHIIIPKQSYTLGGLSSSGFQTVPVLRYMKFNNKLNTRVFVKQMKFLQTHGYQTISLEQFTKFLQFKTQIPSRSVVITIDNNSSFVFKSIYPLLKKFNYHGILFLDPKQVGKGRKSLQWSQIKEMSENGVSIQCKPTGNRDWMHLGKKEQFSDYFDSMKVAYLQPKEILHQNLKKGCDYIAFPKGKSNLLTIKLIQKLGYLGGFSLAGWTNPFFVNPHGISRFSISKDYSEKQFLRILRNFQPYTKGAKWKFGLPLPDEGIDHPLYYQQLGKQLREDMDYPRSLLSWQIAAAFDQKNSALKKTVLETDQQKKTQTKTHYGKARKLHKKRKTAKARTEYLKSLYNDPSHQKALYFVTDRMREREYSVYKIKAADTLKKIAKKEYNDEGKDFLIAFFNKAETINKMKPGEILVIPKLTKEHLKSGYKSGPDIIRVTNLIERENYEDAVALCDNILIQEPGNQQVMELKNVSYKKLGQKFSAEKKPLLSKQAYEKIDPGSPGIQIILKNLVKEIAELAETQYKLGIEYYINEKLVKAIDSWKETLRLNPLHPKAALDIQRARDLLKKIQAY